MKKIILIVAIVFSGLLMQAQTDLEVANAIIGKPISKLEEILTNMELEYYVTFQDENNVVIYLSKNNSIRLWEIKYEDLYRTRLVNKQTQYFLAGSDLMIEVFVRYRHSNVNDLQEFNLYELPGKIEFREYEKSAGAKLSHLRVTQK